MAFGFSSYISMVLKCCLADNGSQMTKVNYQHLCSCLGNIRNARLCFNSVMVNWTGDIIEGFINKQVEANTIQLHKATFYLITHKKIK